MTTPVSASTKAKSKLTKEEWREYTKTVWQIANTTHEHHPAVYPVEIPRRLIKLFTWHGERVLDPFAGAGTTAHAAIPLGRRVTCVEQNKRFVDVMTTECASLRNGTLSAAQLLDVVHGDSRDLAFMKPESVALVVTSPPYWNKADYGSGASNLGKIDGYRRFLREIRPVFEECFRVLKSGRKLCLVTANVNQHTDHGLLTFPLAADFGVLLREIGFVMVTEIIWSKDGTGGRWGSANAQRPIFGSYPYPPNFLFKNVHEYILVFAKPPERPSKGPKVQAYARLMADIGTVEPKAKDGHVPIKRPAGGRRLQPS